MTQTGAIVGTPLYMAPEQCLGNSVISPRADVYAMGVTLFHMLAGRPPFVGENSLSIMAMHANDEPPGLATLNPAISGGTCQLVSKCLAKAPEARYAHAGALLRDLERLLRGEPTSITVHPRLPASDPKNVLDYDFRWDLEASPGQLWPHVSNTERLNRAVGLSAVQFTTEAEPERGVRRFGKIRKLGITVGWQEHPFEWIAPNRMGVLREYSQGPFKWLVSVVELAPRLGGGTTLRHRIWLEPHGLLGRTAAAVEVGIHGRRGLERVYRRIDAALTGKLEGGILADPFEEPAALSSAQAQRLDALLDRLSALHINPTVVERLGDYLARAPAQEVARIRPLALARRLALDPNQVVAACLHGAREGLLLLLWDILCPLCRIPSQLAESLRKLPEHGRCEACNIDFDLDFANSVEMIFRAHPEIRPSELATYCIGGPAHSPHVVAQVRVGPAERLELELALSEGAYRLRGPQLPFSIDIHIEPAALARRLDVSLTHMPGPETPRALRPGLQTLVLTNDHDQEVVVRVERTAARDDALTAARATTSALFRELFSEEVLSPEQLVRVATVALLITELDGAAGLYEQLGDAKAFRVLSEHFRILKERVRQEGGAVVKTVSEGIVAAFSPALAAVRVALDLPRLLAADETTKDLKLRMGVHRGPAMMATVNDHLDYFGSMVHQALQLPRLGRPGDLVLSQEAAADPEVAALLQKNGRLAEVLDARLDGASHAILHVAVGESRE
jgi:class 3 adenylate cyclase